MYFAEPTCPPAYSSRGVRGSLFSFAATATTDIYTLSLHDALPISGCRDVVLLERGELTGGSTFHAAGLVGQLRASVELARVNMMSVELYRRLLDETGRDPGWKGVGSLRVASVPARLRELQERERWARQLGLDAELLSARAARERF